MQSRDPRVLAFWSMLAVELFGVLEYVLGRKQSGPGWTYTDEAGLFRMLGALAFLAFVAGLAAILRRAEALDEREPRDVSSGFSSLVLVAGGAFVTLDLAAGAFMADGEKTWALRLAVPANVALGAMALASTPLLFRLGRSAGLAGLLALGAGGAALLRGFGAALRTKDRGELVPAIDPMGGFAMVLGGVVAIWIVVTAIVIRRLDLRSLT